MPIVPGVTPATAPGLPAHELRPYGRPPHSMAFFKTPGIERKYSMVVLDPPAFAKSRRAVEDASRGYKEINLRALRLLESGGVLVTCSCSHHMSEGAFYEVVAQAALDAGKTLRVLERRTQASDHPILLTVPETMYLKCLVLEVL